MMPGHLLWDVPVGPTVTVLWVVCFQDSLLLLLIRPNSVPPPLFCCDNRSFSNFHTSLFQFFHTNNNSTEFAHHRRPLLQPPATHPSGHPILCRCSAWGHPWVRWNRCLPGLCGFKAPAPPPMLTHNFPTPTNCLPVTFASPIWALPTSHLLAQPPTPHLPSTPGYLHLNLPPHSPVASMSPARVLTSGPGLAGTAGMDSPATHYPVDALPGSTHGSDGTEATLGCVAPGAPAPPSVLTYIFFTPTNCPPMGRALAARRPSWEEGAAGP